jgi:hypothetical protein
LIRLRWIGVVVSVFAEVGDVIATDWVVEEEDCDRML